MKKIVFLFCLAALLPLLAGAWPRVGTVAPDFTVNDTAYNTISLSDYRGQVVQLFFWSFT